MADPEDLVPESEAAPILGLQRATLATWRCQGRGPAFIKIGRRVFYRRRVLLDWIAAQERKPVKAAGGEARQ